MGGKIKQSRRTKNNVRPSSSGRSAEVLSNTINVDTSFVNLSSGKTVPAIFPILTTLNIDENLSSEYYICFKKFNKKDPITKTKALQELTELVKNTNVQEAIAALPSWAHYYQILVFDPDCRVREALQTCHGLIVSVCGRQCAPHLRKLVPAWLIAQYDKHAPVASLAKGQLETTFPDNKLQEALLFCKNEILTLLVHNLTRSPEDMLINKYLDAEEHAQATIRLQTASLRALDHFVTLLPESHENWLWEVITPMFQGNEFWKMATHTLHNVRAAWYGTIGRLMSVLITRFSRELKTRILKALVALPERNAAVATERWAALLVIMHNVQDWSTLLDKKDLLVKRLLDVLENGAWGEARLLTNILLPLLDKLPEELLNKEFYLTFFDAMFTGLHNKNTLNSKSERQIWITSLSECLRYLSIHKYDYVLEIVTYVHRTWLEMIFLVKDNQTRCNLIKHSATNMAGIAKYWLKLTHTSNTPNASNNLNFPQNDIYDQLIRNFWQNTGSTISMQIEKLPLEPNDITNLIDDHILLLKTLNSTFNQEKKQLSIQFADEKVEKVENKSTDKTIYDKALISRYKHNLNNLVETTCCEYFDFAYKKSMSSVVFSSLITLLIEFDSHKLFLAVSKHLNTDSLYSFYDRVLRNWLFGDMMRCKPLVEILFLMVKYFSEDEQDAMYNSFQQFPPALVEWCIQMSQWQAARSVGGASGAKRWLRGSLVGSSVAALCARNDASARALLLGCLAHGDDGEVMINESAVTKIIDTLCSQLSYMENEKNEQFIENTAALGAQVAASLANTSLQAKATPLLLKLFQLNLNVMHGTWSCANSWSETRSVWRDALPSLTPEHRVVVVESALELLHEYVYKNTEELDMKRIEHASTLCPYLLISCETNTNKNIIEIVTLTKKVFKMEPKTPVPLEIFALKIDCIFGNLNCPFEDENNFIQKVVNDNEDTEIDKMNLLLYTHKSVFRSFFLRAMLSRNECLDEEDGVTVHWREELLKDIYYKELFSLVLYDYVVISTLCERYAFWPHYEVIRDAKQGMEKLIDDIISEISLDIKNMILLHISEAAALNGYYWSFARSFFHFKINDKMAEKEQLNETSKNLKGDNEKITSDNQNKCPESPTVNNEAISYRGENVKQNEDDKNSNVLENSATNTLENDNKMSIESIDISKLEEVVTGTGYFHSLQAESKFSSTTSASTLCALMLRSIAAMGGITGNALQEELSGGSGALDAVINVYYKHNELMLYDREVISAPWAHITHNVYIIRYLRHCVETRGWDLPSHYWDFTTITLCSMVTSLKESIKQWGSIKTAMLSQAILELFQCVRTFISNVPARAQKQQPSDHVVALPNEWKDIFAPDLNVNLFEIITFVLNDHKKPMTLSRLAVIDSLLNIIPHLQWERIPAQRLNLLAEGMADAASNALEGLPHQAYLFLAYAALDAVDKPLVLDDMEKLSAWGGTTEEQPPLLSLERLHTPLPNLNDLLEAALQDVVVCERTCETVPASDASRVAVAMLLLGAAMLRRTRLARFDLHHYYVQIAREYDYANYMLPHVLRLLPAEILDEPAPSPALLARFHTMPELQVYEWCNHTTISTLSCSLLTDILGGITGAGAMSYAAALDPSASATLKRIVKNAVSPILLKRQLTALRDRASELADTQVSIQWSRGEVQLSFLADDQTLYLCIQFSDDHPLTPPLVTTPLSLISHASPSRGPSQGTDTHWIVMYLAYHNGSLLNACKMWLTAVSKRLAASPVCYICYCHLLHPPRARPSSTCRTCRKEFHVQCLRKWFSTSYKSNCPVCRSKF